jgi:AcrR family transcriptional regulator
MAPSRQERKEVITRMRKEQILKAAFSVFSEKGFAAATTGEIARIAGVAEGTLYLYFKSKRDLFIEVIQNLIITMSLMDMVKRLPDDDTESVFRGILHNRMRMAEGDSFKSIPFLMMEIQRDPELKSVWAEQAIHPFMSQLDSLYISMKEAGKLREMNTAVVSRGIGGMIIGFILLYIMEGEFNPVKKLSQDEIVDNLVDFILHGILKNK